MCTHGVHVCMYVWMYICAISTTCVICAYSKLMHARVNSEYLYYVHVHPLIFKVCTRISYIWYMSLQGNHLLIGSVGDSRAILGLKANKNTLLALQLTIDLTPNLPSTNSFTSKALTFLTRKFRYICMYCINIYIYTRNHAHTHMYLHAYMHTYMDICTHICVIDKHINIHAYTHT
jgi:hypothetical protein